MRTAISVAFAMPGGESAGSAGGRPVDLAHLARQTMGDRELQSEILRLFVQQALTVSARIALATPNERLLLAHSLKGSARGVGAFAIADCAVELEESPGDELIVNRLNGVIGEVRDFVAAISR